MTSPPLRNQLNFAGGVGHRAVFLVGGGGREHNVGRTRRFGEEEFLHDQQIEFADGRIRACRSVFTWIRAHHIQRFQLSRLPRLPPSAARVHAGLRRGSRRPTVSRIPRALARYRCMRSRATVRQHAHVGGAARIRVVAERHVARLCPAAREPNFTRSAIAAPVISAPKTIDDLGLRIERRLELRELLDQSRARAALRRCASQRIAAASWPSGNLYELRRFAAQLDRRANS